MLIVPGDRSRATVATGPDDPDPRCPSSIRAAGPGQLPIRDRLDPDGYRGPALIVGSPTASDLSTLELYLVFPLASEDRSLALMRGTMLIGGAVLLVLLAAISMLVSRQVVLPIRSASRIAVRFADGRLKERMPVRSEDDMARLAMSFNEMAEKSETDHPDSGQTILQRIVRRHAGGTGGLLVQWQRRPALRRSGDSIPLRRSSGSLITELDRFEALLNDLLSRSVGTTPVWPISRASNWTCGCARVPRSRPCATLRARPGSSCSSTCPITPSSPRSIRVEVQAHPAKSARQCDRSRRRKAGLAATARQRRCGRDHRPQPRNRPASW